MSTTDSVKKHYLHSILLIYFYHYFLFKSWPLTDLPQWSHVWHPGQMIHALVDWQEIQVCQERHPEERNAKINK